MRRQEAVRSAIPFIVSEQHNKIMAFFFSAAEVSNPSDLFPGGKVNGQSISGMGKTARECGSKESKIIELL